MLRGAIESVTWNRIFGWIWSPDAPVAGRRALAFLDEACIGAGPVGAFRPDLKDAGLGDGRAGFNFDLTYPDPADAPRVTVRLEGSDTLLMQKRARIMPAGTVLGERRATAGSAPILPWLRARGWISQADLDFVRGFRALGAHERSLAQAHRAGLADPAEAARHLLMLLHLAEVALATETVPHAYAYRGLADRVERETGPGAALALWAAQRGRLPVIEASHLRAASVPPAPAPLPAMDRAFGPDRLLFVDARCLLGAAAALPPGGVRVMWAGA
jgi:hypothetical protein